MSSKRRLRKQLQRRENRGIVIPDTTNRHIGSLQGLLMQREDNFREQSHASTLATVAPVEAAVPQAPITKIRPMTPELTQEWTQAMVKQAPAVQTEETYLQDGSSLAESQKQRSIIWDQAKQNRDYYENAVRKDNSGKAWFLYPKHNFQYAEFVMMSPEMAEAMIPFLWTTDHGNRRLKRTLVETYCRDLENDRWVPSNEGIGISINGEVFDGQHRLNAVVAAKKEWPFWCTWNVLNEAKFVVDSGSKRSVSEKLSMIVTNKLSNRAAGMCKAMMRGINPKVRFSETEIAEFAYKYEQVICWMSEVLPVARAEVQAACGKAYLWNIEHRDKLVAFCDRLREVTFNSEGDPAKALFMFLNRAKQSHNNVPLVCYKKTLAALNSYFNDKPLSKVLERDEDVFEWLPGWELPPR